MLPPRPSSIITRAAAWLPMKAARTFMRATASKPRSETSSVGAWKLPPALLNIESSRPKRSRAPATSARSESGSRTSVGIETASPPASAIMSAVSWPVSGLISPIATRAPMSAMPIAIARPMPLPAPVTTATRPSMRMPSIMKPIAPSLPIARCCPPLPYSGAAGRVGGG